MNGKTIGNYGDASMFSFHSTKTFNTLEGGAITCSDINLHERLKDLRNFGIRGEEEIVSPGINAKMNEVQAVFGLLNLKKINNSIKKKKRLFEKYHSLLKDVPGVKFQQILDGTSYNYAYLTIEILPDKFGLSRDSLYICMRKEGIIVRKYFYPLCSNYPCYSALPSSKKELLPNANQLASRVLCLPLFEEMKEEDVDKISELIYLLHTQSNTVKKALDKIEKK